MDDELQKEMDRINSANVELGIQPEAQVEEAEEVSKSEEDATKQTTEEEVQEEPQSQEETHDYAALYEEEKARREKAEHKIVKLRAKKLEEEPQEDEDEQPDDIKSYVDQRLNEIKYSTLELQYDSAIKQVSTNPDEQKLIRFYLEENNFSGDVETQVAKAKALANYKTVVKANQELSHAKSTVPGTEDSSGYKAPSEKQISGLSERDKAYLKKRGLLKAYTERFGT